MDLSTLIILGILLALIVPFFMGLLGGLRGSPKRLTSLGSPKKPFEPNQTYSKSSYLSKSDVKLIATTAKRLIQIINESLQIANTTKNTKTKTSRVRLARQKLIELKEYSQKYPFLEIDKLCEAWKGDLELIEDTIIIKSDVLSVKVDGKATHEYAESHKNDLAMMKRCCDEEINNFNQNKIAPAPYYFERVAILSHKVKDYKQEKMYCEMLLNALRDYNKYMISKGEKPGYDFADVMMSPRVSNIKKRLEKLKTKKLA